jgi:hypothetical protein
MDDSAAGVVQAPSSQEDDATDAARPSPAEQTDDSRWVQLLEWFDEKVYVVVGIMFLLAALLSLAYGLVFVGDQLFVQMLTPSGFSLQGVIDKGLGAQDIIALVSDLLLTLIIMEVLGTVVHHLREGETTLRPFLFIGIISATRGILAVGARLSVSTNGTLSREEFIRDMVELGVNALVIIALGVAMKLIGTYLEVGATTRHRLAAGNDGAGAAGQGTSARARNGAPGVRSAVPAGAPLGGLRALFVLMVLIVLVALTLIGVMVSSGIHH